MKVSVMKDPSTGGIRVLEGSELNDPSGGIRAEGSKLRDPNSERKNVSRRIRADGYKLK